MLTPAPGIYPDIDEQEYRSWGALAHSDLRSWVRGPHPPATRAMILGSAFHTAVLEPGELKKRYGVLDSEVDLRTKEGKAAFESWSLMNPGLIALRPSERDMLRGLVSALKTVPQHDKCLSLSGFSEVAIVADWDGVLVKGRLDRFCERDGKTLIVDWKTSHSVGPREFTDSIVKFGYDSAAAWYRRLVHSATGKWSPFAWIVASKTSMTAWWQLCDPIYLATGDRWIDDVLELYRRHHATQ